MSTFEQIVEQHHKIEFASTVELALQQMGPKLRPFVTVTSFKGESVSYLDVYGTATASRRTGRKSDNLDAPVQRTRRWMNYQDPIQSGEYITEPDMWRSAMDPTSSLIQAHTQAIGRGIDNLILTGLTGDAYEGKRGETTVPLPAGQKVGIQVGSGASPADVGMNVEKLRAARKKLLKAHVDLSREEAFCAITADEHDALFDFVQVTSADFNGWGAGENPVIRDGRLERLLGFTLVPYEDVLVNEAGTIRYVPAWVRSGVTLGVVSDIRPRLWNDSSKQQAAVFNIDFVGDCRRGQDGKVVEIACKIPT